MLAFRGVDNVSYYRLMPDAPRFYQDFTGTGNSLNPVHPSVLRLIMDSLRYFVIECHVDGFRFDLASALAREFYEVDRLSAFFDTIHQDPVISQVKLIAEPWDVGPGGYQVGNFPVLWAEWNGVYRDTMRDFWRGTGERRRVRVAFHGLERPLRPRTGATRSRRSTSSPRTTASRCATSSRTTRSTTRRTARGTGTAPTTTAPGTTASRARRRPGDQRATRAAAAELPRHAAALAGRADAARRRRARADAARQQQRVVPGQRALVVRLGARGRRAARVRATADPAAARASGLPAHDVPHRPRDARVGPARRLVVPPRRAPDDAARLAAARTPARSACSSTAREIPSRTAHGEEIVDDSFLLLFNAQLEPVAFTLPTRRFGARWEVELATGEPPGEEFPARAEVMVPGRSLTLLLRN